jgi:hypothetical protein
MEFDDDFESSGLDPVGVVSPQVYDRVLRKWVRERRIDRVALQLNCVERKICKEFELMATGNLNRKHKMGAYFNYPVKGMAWMKISKTGKSMENSTKEIFRLSLGGCDYLLPPAVFKEELGMFDSFPFHRDVGFKIPAWLWEDNEYVRLTQNWVREEVRFVKAAKKAHDPLDPAHFPLSSHGDFPQTCCRKDNGKPWNVSK